MAGVRVENITKRYGDVYASDHVTLSFQDGKLTTLLGPSGSGKTTLLRVVAGLTKPDSGRVFFGDKDVTRIPPHKRAIGFVFQSIALFPHMDVARNVAFGLKMRGYPKEQWQKRIDETLELLHIRELRNRRSRQLSGGQAQRVAIARVLAPDPEILLLDEPLSSLDAKLVEEFRYEIRRIQKETAKTAIYVTHVQMTAMIISDEIVLLDEGRVQQIGSPSGLYLTPKTSFAADFIGTTNFLEGTVTHVDSQSRLITVECGALTVRALESGTTRSAGEAVTAAVKAEDLSILSSGEEAEEFRTIIEGEITAAVFAGEKVILRVKADETLLQVYAYGPDRHTLLGREGDRVKIGSNQFYLIGRSMQSQ